VGGRGQFGSGLRRIVGSMERKPGPNWTVLPRPQPIHPKSDRLLARGHSPARALALGSFQLHSGCLGHWVDTCAAPLFGSARRWWAHGSLSVVTPEGWSLAGPQHLARRSASVPDPIQVTRSERSPSARVRARVLLGHRGRADRRGPINPRAEGATPAMPVGPRGRTCRSGWPWMGGAWTNALEVRVASREIP
jgi:hypothetical protein